MKKLKDGLVSKKASLAEDSRTSKLWIQYMEYISIIKMFIRVERSGNWEEHLNATEKMLNLYAATGHIHYVKSARLYLQMMLSLRDIHPWLYQQFSENGFHAVRWSEKILAVLWSEI